MSNEVTVKNFLHAESEALEYFKEKLPCYKERNLGIIPGRTEGYKSPCFPLFGTFHYGRKSGFFIFDRDAKETVGFLSNTGEVTFPEK